MEHVSLSELANVFGFLTACDVAGVTMTCRSLQPRQETVQLAIELVVRDYFGDIVGFLRQDDTTWPRSALVLRAAETLRVKAWLAAQTYAQDDSASNTPKASSFFVSKAWVLAWKRRCQPYEKFVLQFRNTKKKIQQRERSKGGCRQGEPFVDTEINATKDAAQMIICPHDGLLPAKLCVGRSKRMVVSRAVYRKLAVLASDIHGFQACSSDCRDCVKELEAKERAAEAQRLERFENEISGSNELLDILLRKTGFPQDLFSPATTRGHTHVSLQNGLGKSYFLVPKKWLSKWRDFARSLGDECPGPILNADLVCLAHQRSIIPPYINMFLAGFSIEQSLQATQV